jgi:PAS domain S-box-containing protein/putative nucleotidyltransferase with HDIG domain
VPRSASSLEALTPEALFQLHPQPLLLVDSSVGRLLEVNDAALLLYGYGRDAFLGMHLTDLWADDEALPDLDALAREDGGEVVRHRTATVDRLPVQLAMRSLPDEPPRWLVTVQDVSRQVEAEESARRSERLYRAIVENAFDGVALLGPDLTNRTVGSRAAAALGFRTLELAGRDRRDLIHPADRKLFQDASASCGAGPASVRASPTACATPTGAGTGWKGPSPTWSTTPTSGRSCSTTTTSPIGCAPRRRRRTSTPSSSAGCSTCRPCDASTWPSPTPSTSAWRSTSSWSRCRPTSASRRPACCCSTSTLGRCSPPPRAASAARWRATRSPRSGEGLAGYAALEQRTVYVQDLQADERWGSVVAPEHQRDYVAYWAVPMLTKGHLQGVIELYAKRAFVPDAEWFEFLETFADQGAIAVESVLLFRSLERSNVELQLAYDKTIEGWAYALDLKDEETAGHSQRVTQMTVRLAQRIGVDQRELIHIQRGALLHDIGKMGVPDSVLLKRGPLSDEERKLIEQHTVYAYELLSPIDFLRPAIDIPYCHHERWDGTGYPRGLAGEEIPLAARIFAIVDVYDALTSERPYRPPGPARTPWTTSASMPGSTSTPPWSRRS